MPYLVAIGLVLLVVVIWQLRRAAVVSARNERRAEQLAASGGQRTGYEVSDAVRSLASRGNRVAALQLYRQETGADLDYALSVVEPLLPKQALTGSEWAIAAVLFVVIIGGGLWFFVFSNP